MTLPADPHSVEIQDAPEKKTKEEDMRKRLVFGVAAIVVAIAGGFAIKAGRGAAAVPASAAMAANTPGAAASEVPLDFTPNEAARPLKLALPQVVEFSGPLVAPNTAIVRAKATGTLLSLAHVTVQ